MGLRNCLHCEKLLRGILKEQRNGASRWSDARQISQTVGLNSDASRIAEPVRLHSELGKRFVDDPRFTPRTNQQEGLVRYAPAQLSNDRYFSGIKAIGLAEVPEQLTKIFNVNHGRQEGAYFGRSPRSLRGIYCLCRF